MYSVGYVYMEKCTYSSFTHSTHKMADGLFFVIAIGLDTLKINVWSMYGWMDGSCIRRKESQPNRHYVEEEKMLGWDGKWMAMWNES